MKYTEYNADRERRAEEKWCNETAQRRQSTNNWFNELPLRKQNASAETLKMHFRDQGASERVDGERRLHNIPPANNGGFRIRLSLDGVYVG